MHDLFSCAGRELAPYGDGLLLVSERPPYVRLRARVSDAASLPPEVLSAEVASRYTAIDAALGALGKRPVRFWNYVPGIVEPVGAGMDRYMAFNRGRHAACTGSSHLGGADGSIATASAIGVESADLVIDCLASADGGTPVENPRQVASWRYSRRYGPRPPFFARGTRTLLDGRPVLLLGGTASIVGEESRHVGDIEAQVDELLTNMAALIAQAGVNADGALARLTDARIYVVDPDDAEVVEAGLTARAGPHIRLQTARSRICRPELLVEVEGVAALGPA